MGWMTPAVRSVHRSLHPPSLGPCSLRSRITYLTNWRNCTSVNPERIQTCEGHCQTQEDQFQRDFCCDVKSYQDKARPTYVSMTGCPGDDPLAPYKEGAFLLATECECKECERGTPPKMPYKDVSRWWWCYLTLSSTSTIYRCNSSPGSFSSPPPPTPPPLTCASTSSSSEPQSPPLPSVHTCTIVCANFCFCCVFIVFL